MSQLPRVGIISDERYPSTFTDTQQVMKNAAALARAGLPVELLIPRPLHRLGWSAARAHGELAGYYNLRPPLPVHEIFTVPTGRLRLEKLSHGLVAPLSLALRRFDVIYSRNLIPAALTLALGRPLVFETYRAWGYERPALTRQLSRFARAERFVGVITHSAYAAGSLVEAGLPPEKVVVLHNGYDPADMEPTVSQKEARRVLGLAGDRPLLVYAGNMQPNKGVETAIDVAARVPETELLLVGGQPSHVARLRAYAAAVGAMNVTFTGHRPVGEVPRYLCAADVLIVPPTAGPLKTHGRTVLPMKLFVYLAAGRPILAPDLPDTGELLHDDENACLVRPDEPERTAAALRAIVADPDRAERLAAGARATGASLTWDARAEKLKAWLLERLAVTGTEESTATGGPQ